MLCLVGLLLTVFFFNDAFYEFKLLLLVIIVNSCTSYISCILCMYIVFVYNNNIGIFIGTTNWNAVYTRFLYHWL